MTFLELFDTIQYEAGIPDLDSLGGWLEQEFLRTCNELTGAVNYPELYVQDTIVNITGAGTGTFTLPANFQKLDDDAVRYYPNDSFEDSYFLLKSFKPQREDIDASRYFSLIITPVLGYQIKIWPKIETVANDKIYINYWRKMYTPGIESLTSTILPDQLVATIIKEMVQRACMIAGDSKRFQAATALGNRSYSRSFGVTKQSDC